MKICFLGDSITEGFGTRFSRQKELYKNVGYYFDGIHLNDLWHNFFAELLVEEFKKCSLIK